MAARSIALSNGSGELQSCDRQCDQQGKDFFHGDSSLIVLASLPLSAGSDRILPVRTSFVWCANYRFRWRAIRLSCTECNYFYCQGSCKECNYLELSPSSSGEGQRDLASVMLSRSGVGLCRRCTMLTVPTPTPPLKRRGLGSATIAPLLRNLHSKLRNLRLCFPRFP